MKLSLAAIAMLALSGCAAGPIVPLVGAGLAYTVYRDATAPNTDRCVDERTYYCAAWRKTRE